MLNISLVRCAYGSINGHKQVLVLCWCLTGFPKVGFESLGSAVCRGMSLLQLDLLKQYIYYRLTKMLHPTCRVITWARVWSRVVKVVFQVRCLIASILVYSREPIFFFGR